MKGLITTIAAIFLNSLIVCGQRIEIGQDANQIKSAVESSVNDHNKSDDGGNSSNSYWNWDVKYNYDTITEVIQCYSNQYLAGLGTVSYYCKHYVMQDGRLAYTITQFEDMDSVQVKKYFEANYRENKIGDLFFSENFTHYSIIYADNKGNAIIECHKAGENEMPPEMQAEIEKRLKEQQEAKRVNMEETEAKKQREIKSKTYDLEVYDSAAYDLFINDLRQSLIEGLKSYSSFPEWAQIENESKKCFTFSSSYEASFKLVDRSIENAGNGYLLLPVINNFASDNHFVLISGDDNACSFLKYASPSLPTINYKGYNVMTDAGVKDIDVFYIKGITHIKIKDGVVTYKKYLPPAEIQESLSQKLKTLSNGLYHVKYKTGKVMGQSFITTENEKMVTTGGRILRVTGAIVFLSILFILNYS